MGGHVTYTLASGVTDGACMRGVRFFGGGHRVSSLILSSSAHRIRFVASVHTGDGADIVVEF